MVILNLIRDMKLIKTLAAILVLAISLSSCEMVKQSSKYNFNDGIYTTSRFSQQKVYVLQVDDDTLSVFPVIEFVDSTAVLTKQRVNYIANQRKFKDNKVSHSFFRPSLDVDIMTLPLKYRFPAGQLPNTLTTNFNGAFYFGYRIDEYRLNYKRTPLNTYKQSIKHIGYSAGFFTGIGSALINSSMLNDQSFAYEYDGVLLITGIAANLAVDKFTVGIALGTDFLMDKYHSEWIYEGKPYIGFTLGLNLN